MHDTNKYIVCKNNRLVLPVFNGACENWKNLFNVDRNSLSLSLIDNQIIV